MSAPILHLINDDGELAKPAEVTSFIRDQVKERSGGKQTLDDVGLKYRVIGVFGGQSSGKSTLLNHVFGTKFDTMDDSRGRQQTTKGAFISPAQKGENCFVVDFEGTDGMERGEDQTFERQLSLFALSVADTLVINMWANEVGRFNAANLSLLRTVFEVNLQLFANMENLPEGSGIYDPSSAERDKQKPTLLFVLRDHASGSSDALFESVNRSLEKVWEGVTKPKRFALSALDDLFELKYQAMSHYVYCKDKFEDEVKQLQSNFTEPGSESYYYTSEETFRGVPLEGLGQYLSSCWVSIKDSKDLNIPSQREMLATVRCTEVIRSFQRAFADQLHEMKLRIEKGDRIEMLGIQLENKIEEIQEQFEATTRLYTSRIVSKSRRQLDRSLKEKAMELIKYQCCFVINDELGRADAKIQRVVDTATATLCDPTVVKTLKKENPSLDAAALKQQRVLHFWSTVRSGINDLVEELQKNLGSSARRSLSGDESSLSSTTRGSANSKFLHSDPQSLDTALGMLKDGVCKKIRTRFEGMAADAPNSMSRLFEQSLNTDPKTKLQRNFRSTQAFQEAYQPALEHGLLLLATMFALRLEEPTAADDDILLTLEEDTKPQYPGDEVVTQLMDAQRSSAIETPIGLASPTGTEGSMDDTQQDAGELLQETERRASVARADDTPTCVILITESAVDRAYELYQQQCQFTFKLRMHQIESSQSGVPLKFLGLLLLLGLNEIWYVLTSPVLLIFAVVIGWFFFRFWIEQQWQLFVETGPAHLVIPAQNAVAFISGVIPQGMKDSLRAAHESGSAAQPETEGDSTTPGTPAATPRTSANNRVHATATEEASTEALRRETSSLRRRNVTATKED